MISLDRISDANKITDRFGHWPSFHDAEILRIVLDRQSPAGPSAEIFFDVWVRTDEVDEKGYFKIRDRSLVHLSFQQLKQCNLSGFNHQNVLWALEIESDEVESQPLIRVTFPTSFGLEGMLLCENILVKEVTPLYIQVNEKPQT